MDLIIHRGNHIQHLSHSGTINRIIHSGTINRIMSRIHIFIPAACFFYVMLMLSISAHADVVSAMGDSITHGHGQVPYPSVLQQLIDGTAQKVQVVNYGQSGERTDQGVNRIDKVLAQSHPNYIIIMEGADDVIAGLSPTSVKFNLGVMIDKSRGAGAAPVLDNITPDTRFNANSVISSAYNPQISGLAGEKNVALVDAYGALIVDWPHLNVDGLHPNSAGHRILAQNFYNALPYSKGGGSVSGDGDGGGGGGGGGAPPGGGGGGALPNHSLNMIFSPFGLCSQIFTNGRGDGAGQNLR